LTYTLYAFPESDNLVTPLYALVNSAQHTIDMTMYALETPPSPTISSQPAAVG